MPRDSDRVATGIQGLDKLIQGGFVKGSTVLLSGEAGTGKTLFSLRFLWEGLQKGEPGVYITLEETAEDIKKDAEAFGWDFSKYEKSGKFAIIEKNLFENPELDFLDLDRHKAKRLVMDSISILSIFVEDQAKLRNKLNEMIAELRRKGVTVIMVSEGTPKNPYSRLGVEEYITDAVVRLDFTPIGPQAGRNLFIKKMRRTKHSENIHPFEIGKDGIKVLSI
ncbi:MAG: ATPase [Candidatus Aenigmarchaeota archaeon]|nr:ATPase [Candidatus Aenigmarchaeota archaeon]